MAFVGKWFGFGRDEHYDLAIRAYDRGLFEEAIEEFARCIENSADPATLRLAKFYTAESYSFLGQAAIRSEDFDHAIRFFKSALTLHPTYPDLYFSLAQAYRGFGDRPLQTEALTKALELNETYARAILFQGIIFIEDGEVQRGLSRIKEAVRIESALDGERYRFALASVKQGDIERAVANFETMFSDGSEDASTHAQLAESFARQGLWQEAASEYVRALDLAPEYADIRCSYGQTLLELDQVDYAADQFEAAIRINSNYADAHAYLGIALRRQGKQGEAKNAFRDALEADPHHVIASQEFERIRA